MKGLFQLFFFKPVAFDRQSSAQGDRVPLLLQLNTGLSDCCSAQNHEHETVKKESPGSCGELIGGMEVNEGKLKEP